jgi:hypothetical protein
MLLGIKIAKLYLRIKNKIKFLYTKKQHLNKTLYTLHLENANKWGNLWEKIHKNILDKIEKKIHIKYKKKNTSVALVR